MKNGTINLSCIGLDCHRKFSLASARGVNGRILWRQRVEHADRDALRQQIRSWARGTAVILEATFGWGWMSDELKAAGLDVHLCSGRKVSGVRDARQMAKNNRKDADLLSELWTEKHRWWEVWTAPPEVRDMRELLRRRMALVGMQTQLKNQIHATLHRHGLVQPFSDLFGAAGRKWLEQQLKDPASVLRAMGKDTLSGQLRLLDQIRQEVAQLTREFRKRVLIHPAARRLMTLPGVSTILAYTIIAEIGDIGRFKDSRALSRYSTLAPMSDDSGDETSLQNRHIGKAGRAVLKWAWVEAAHLAVRKDASMRQLFDRHTAGGTRDRSHGYIAVAHRLCQVGYVLWKKDVEYTQTPPPRPGSKPPEAKEQSQNEPKAKQLRGKELHGRKLRKEDSENESRDVSRPGTDQPDSALAAEQKMFRQTEQ